jgi:CDP-diacylglycerol--glycerol-3-phosphate 3-phosphatidyltransferase
MKPVKENIYTIPNLLSIYRLLIFPYIAYLVYTRDARLFAVFLCISLVTDILDGLIARMFRLTTQLGARLDSIADLGTYFLAVYGIIVFRWENIESSLWLAYIFFFVFILGYVIAVIKFGRIQSLHLYSAKAAGYLQGIFFFTLFTIGYYPWIFYIAVTWGILALTEEIIILLMLKNLASDVKGLWWILKKDRR